MSSSRDKVGYVGGEIGVGEFTFARAKAGEVESQRGDAVRGELLRDAARGEDVLAAGEAVGEQCIGAGRFVGPIEPRGELLVIRARKRDALGLHSPIVTTGRRLTLSLGPALALTLTVLLALGLAPYVPRQLPAAGPSIPSLVGVSIDLAFDQQLG